MSGLGSGDNGEFTFMDILSILSLCIALQNNSILTQEDKEELEDELSMSIQEIHQHLQIQDNKINKILQLLEGKENGDNKNSGRPNK